MAPASERADSKNSVIGPVVDVIGLPSDVNRLHRDKRSPAGGRIDSRPRVSARSFSDFCFDGRFEFFVARHSHGMKSQHLHATLAGEAAQLAGQQQCRDQRRVELDRDSLGAFRQPMPVVGPSEYTFEPAEEQLDGPALVVNFGDQRRAEALPVQLVGRRRSSRRPVHFVGSTRDGDQCSPWKVRDQVASLLGCPGRASPQSCLSSPLRRPARTIVSARHPSKTRPTACIPHPCVP